jgi:hypothetical protein
VLKLDFQSTDVSTISQRQTAMNLKLSLATFCCLLTVGTTTRSFAQDPDDLAKESDDLLAISQETPQRPSWESRVETTWLAGSEVRNSGGNLNMGEVTAEFTKRFSINPKLELSTGFKYGLREIDAPASALLPDSLQTLAVQVGAEYRKSDDLTLGFRVSPSVKSDFKAFESKDLRLLVEMHAKYQLNRKLTLLGGIAYTGEQHSFPVLPVLGVLYTPSERWGFALGFPRTKIMYMPYKGTELFLGATFSGGEYRLHDAAVGANVISYKDYRAVAGVELPLYSVARLAISGGYAFGRKFTFDEGNRADLKLGNAPFCSMDLKFLW